MTVTLAVTVTVTVKIFAAKLTETIANIYKGSSPIKKTVKKPDIVRSWGGGGVNPSSLIKPKFTGSSNRPEMDGDKTKYLTKTVLFPCFK